MNIRPAYQYEMLRTGGAVILFLISAEIKSQFHGAVLSFYMLAEVFLDCFPLVIDLSRRRTLSSKLF